MGKAARKKLAKQELRSSGELAIRESRVQLARQGLGSEMFQALLRRRFPGGAEPALIGKIRAAAIEMLEATGHELDGVRITAAIDYTRGGLVMDVGAVA